MPAMTLTPSEARVYFRHLPNAGLTAEQSAWYRRRWPHLPLEDVAMDLFRSGYDAVRPAKPTPSEQRLTFRRLPNAGLTQKQADYFRRHWPDVPLEEFALELLGS